MSIKAIVDDVMNSGLSMNNVSRAVFSKVKAKYDLEQVKGRSGNYFITNRGPIGFTLTTKRGISEARQFYTDLKGLFCYNVVDKELHYIDEVMLVRNGYNLGNQKRKAVSTEFNNSKQSKVDMRAFGKIVKGM